VGKTLKNEVLGYVKTKQVSDNQRGKTKKVENRTIVI